MEIFARRIRELRVEKGLLQRQLADLINMSQDTVSAWERNKNEPSIYEIVKLAKIFDVSSDYLLGIKDF